MKSGVREVPDCSGVKGKGFVCYNTYIFPAADPAERVKQSRRQCRPLAVGICIVWMLFFFLAVAMRYGDSTGN